MRTTSITVFYDSSIDKRVATIFLEGDLQINSARKVKNDLFKAIEKFEYLEVILKNITKIDMAFLHVLQGLKDSAKKYNKTIVYDLELPEEIRSLLSS
jgi:ABC-type transporter Mla MlaB component